MVHPFVFMVCIHLNSLHFKEWLRHKSGINKKYFEGEAYKALRAKVKASCRYARTEVKDVVRVHVSHHLSLRDDI